MRGRDITRLPSKWASRFFLLFTLVICAGMLLELPAQTPSNPPQSDSKPAATPPVGPPPLAQGPGQQTPANQNQTRNLKDQGELVFAPLGTECLRNPPF